MPLITMTVLDQHKHVDCVDMCPQEGRLDATASIAVAQSQILGSAAPDSPYLPKGLSVPCKFSGLLSNLALHAWVVVVN